MRVVIDRIVGNKKAPQKQGLVILGESDEIDFVETSFSNSPPTVLTRRAGVA